MKTAMMSSLTSNGSLDVQFAGLGWWSLTITLGVILLVYGIWKKVWQPFVVYVLWGIILTLIVGIMNHKEVVHADGTAASPRSLHVNFRLTDVNWYAFVAILAAIYAVLFLRANSGKRSQWGIGALIVAGLALLFGVAPEYI